MKAIIISVSIIAFVGLVTGMTLVYAQRQATGLPENTPSNYLSSSDHTDDAEVVVCVGNSITHGAVSANYVDLLEEMNLGNYDFVNAGINSQLSYNILVRLDEIYACDPDIITVLIGTNDANSMMSKANEERYIKEQVLPRVPDELWFRDNIRAIADGLKSGTDARIAFLSLPTMGEDLSAPAYQMSFEYSKIIKEEADRAGVACLPLHEEMTTYLKSNPSEPRYAFSKMRSLMFKNILGHYVFGRSWDGIAKSNGFALHADHLHLNEAGAKMVADLIADFIVHGDPNEE